jgi:hypothetical protein
MRLFQRKRVFVDFRVQGALLLRIVFYWFCGLFVASLFLVYLKIISGAADPLRFDLLWEEHRSVVLASLMILPAILYDMAVMSNRFVGPLYRIRRSINALAAGERISPVHFRKKEYWQDLAADINALGEYIQRLQKQAVAANQPDANTDGKLEFEAVAGR